MKKRNRIEMEKKIVARVKREMDQPRLTESVRNVRNGLSAPATPCLKKSSARA